MAPVTQYVFAEMLVISKHFAAGSHKWLPYSKNKVRLKCSNTSLSFRAIVNSAKPLNNNLSL